MYKFWPKDIELILFGMMNLKNNNVFGLKRRKRQKFYASALLFCVNLKSLIMPLMKYKSHHYKQSALLYHLQIQLD